MTTRWSNTPDNVNDVPVLDSGDPYQRIDETPTEKRTNVPAEAPSSPSDALAHDEALEGSETADV